jgi:hypothetical protein
MKRITLATIKSFIKKNRDTLQIMTESSFDGMTDMVEYQRERSFKPIVQTESNVGNTLGIEGAWFVKGSRDHFTVYESNGFKGFHVYNCCGSFTLGVQS